MIAQFADYLEVIQATDTLCGLETIVHILISIPMVYRIHECICMYKCMYVWRGVCSVHIHKYIGVTIADTDEATKKKKQFCGTQNSSGSALAIKIHTIMQRISPAKQWRERATREREREKREWERARHLRTPHSSEVHSK